MAALLLAGGDATGLQVNAISTAVLAQLPLDAIDAVTFYKTDLLTTDCICCDVAAGGTMRTFHEEQQGWNLLLAHLAELPGFRSDWYEAVVKPPFARCETLAFVRNPAAASTRTSPNTRVRAPRRRFVYACLAAAVLMLEIGIALFVDDAWVRPYGGDSLAVILAYLVLRATTPLGRGGAAGAALALAVLIELAQLARLPALLGLEANRLATVVLGASFDPLDLLFYGAGAALALLLDRRAAPAWARAPSARSAPPRDAGC